MKRVFLLILAFLLLHNLIFASFNVIAEASKLDESFDVEAITKELFNQELAWKVEADDQITVTIKNLTLNDEIFINKTLLKGVLSISGNSYLYEQGFSILIGENDNIVSLYKEKLKSIIRENSYQWFAIPSDHKIDDVLASGVWTLAKNESFFIGQRIYLEDYKKKHIALLTVSDKQSFEDEFLYELKPLWIKHSIIKGMPISLKKDKGSSDFKIQLYLKKISASFSYSYPIKSSLFQIALENELSLDFYSLAISNLVYVGLERTFALASLMKKDKDAHWYNNISFRGSVKLGLGVLYEDDYSFVYGSKGGFIISYHSNARLKYSLGISYRHLFNDNIPNTNIRDNLSIVSSIAWMW